MWSLWKVLFMRLHTLVLFAHLPISGSCARSGAAICTVVDVERDADYFETRGACMHFYLIFLVFSTHEDCSFFLAVLRNNHPSLSDLNVKCCWWGYRGINRSGLNLQCQFDCETCQHVHRWNQLAS